MIDIVVVTNHQWLSLIATGLLFIYHRLLLPFELIWQEMIKGLRKAEVGTGTSPEK